MEQFIREIGQYIPEIVQFGLNLVVYFLIFLYRRHFTKTGNALTLSMKELLGTVAKGRTEDAATIAELNKRLKRCEAALQIYVADEGGRNGTDGTDGT